GDHVGFHHHNPGPAVSRRVACYGAWGRISRREGSAVLVVKTSGAGVPSPIPSELKAVRDALWQDVVFVHTKWNIFKELHSTKESVDLLNFGGDEYFGIN